MSVTDSGGAVDTESLRVVFFSAGGVRFGADIAQIAEMVDIPEAAGEDSQLRYLWGTVPFGSGASGYLAPKRLLLKGKPAALIVDSPSDIMTLGLEAVRELPPLIRSVCTLPIWGVALVDDAVIMLLDLDAIVKE